MPSVNVGFPDHTRIEPLIEACMFFAEETGMHWLGGLGYGSGVMINGAYLEDLGKKGEKISLAFKMALQNVFRGEKITLEAQKLMMPNIPQVFYRPLAAFLNYRAKKLAREKGNVDITKKVYLE